MIPRRHLQSLITTRWYPVCTLLDLIALSPVIRFLHVRSTSFHNGVFLSTFVLGPPHPHLLRFRPTSDTHLQYPSGLRSVMPRPHPSSVRLRPAPSRRRRGIKPTVSIHGPFYTFNISKCTLAHAREGNPVKHILRACYLYRSDADPAIFNRTYTSCFCQSSYLAPLKAGSGTSVCPTCSTADMGTTQQWYNGLCAAPNGAAVPGANGQQTTTSSITTTTPTQSTSTAAAAATGAKTAGGVTQDTSGTNKAWYRPPFFLRSSW